MSEGKSVQLTVVRAEPGQTPYQETTTAPVTAASTVLDLLEWAKAGVWPSLVFRYSCRSGVCGSCGVMVNGRPVLACETNAFGYLTSGITVAPLARIPVLRDLVTDVDGFLTRLRKSMTWLVPGVKTQTRVDAAPEVSTSAGNSADRSTAGAATSSTGGVVSTGSTTGPKPVAAEPQIKLQTPAELELYRTLSECINCLLCYSACPVFPVLNQGTGMSDEAGETNNPAASSVKKKTDTPTDPEFYGPAALLLARRWDLDSRDHGNEPRDEAVGENEHGIWPCTQDGSCTRVCPKGLDPKAAIGQLQKQFLA